MVAGCCWDRSTAAAATRPAVSASAAPRSCSPATASVGAASRPCDRRRRRTASPGSASRWRSPATAPWHLPAAPACRAGWEHSGFTVWTVGSHSRCSGWRHRTSSPSSPTAWRSPQTARGSPSAGAKSVHLFRRKATGSCRTESLAAARPARRLFRRDGGALGRRQVAPGRRPAHRLRGGRPLRRRLSLRPVARSWALARTIRPATNAADANFGHRLAISPDGRDTSRSRAR